MTLIDTNRYLIRHRKILTQTDTGTDWSDTRYDTDRYWHRHSNHTILDLTQTLPRHPISDTHRFQLTLLYRTLPDSACDHGLVTWRLSRIFRYVLFLSLLQVQPPADGLGMVARAGFDRVGMWEDEVARGFWWVRMGSVVVICYRLWWFVSVLIKCMVIRTFGVLSTGPDTPAEALTKFLCRVSISLASQISCWSRKCANSRCRYPLFPLSHLSQCTFHHLRALRWL